MGVLPDSVAEQRSDKYAKYLVLFCLGMALCASAIFGVVYVTSSRGRSHLLEELNSLGANAQVRLNNVEAPEPRALIQLLKSTAPFAAHHSHPTRPIAIAIRDDSRIVLLTVARDSERQDEYWVFRPATGANGNPFGLELGRFTGKTFTLQLTQMGL